MTHEESIHKMLEQVLKNQMFIILGLIGTGADVDAGSAHVEATSTLLERAKA